MTDKETLIAEMKADIRKRNLRIRYTTKEVDMAFSRLSVDSAKSFLHFLDAYRSGGFTTVSDEKYPMKYAAYQYVRYGYLPGGNSNAGGVIMAALLVFLLMLLLLAMAV